MNSIEELCISYQQPPLNKNVSKKDIKHSSVFIQYQDFPFPWPIIRYICTNGNSLTQLKLFSTCQQLKNFVAKVRGCQVDAVYFSWRKWYNGQNHSLLSHELYIKEKRLIQLDLSYENRETINDFPQPVKVKSLHFDLNDIYVDYEEIITYLQRFDYSIAKKVDIWMYDEDFNQTLNIDVFRPMFVSSLEKLLLNTTIEVVNGDLLTMALTELPKLRKLRMGWQEGITNLSSAAAIPRTTKLTFFELGCIKGSLTTQTIFNFISNQMSDKGVIELDVNNEFACKCFHKEIQEMISTQLPGVKLKLYPKHECKHKKQK